MAAAETILHVTVRGRVQGVGFRNFVQLEALRLGVSGWVRNLRNGDVEAVFAGGQEAVDALCELCRRGPRHAIVESLDATSADRSLLTEMGWQTGFLQLETL
jgi:acylphosphatase